MSFCTPPAAMGIARRPLRSELSRPFPRSSTKPYFGIAAVNAVFKIIPQQGKKLPSGTVNSPPVVFRRTPPPAAELSAHRFEQAPSSARACPRYGSNALDYAAAKALAPVSTTSPRLYAPGCASSSTRLEAAV